MRSDKVISNAQDDIGNVIGVRNYNPFLDTLYTMVSSQMDPCSSLLQTLLLRTCTHRLMTKGNSISLWITLFLTEPMVILSVAIMFLLFLD